MLQRFGLGMGIIVLLAGCSSKAVVEGVPADMDAGRFDILD